MTAVANSNRGDPVAVAARSLSKRYRLGQHQSLQATINRLLRRDAGAAGNALEALRDVEFVVKRGEAFGIVGTNGSGKSTLLQILSGATLPTGGEMEVWGRLVPLLAVGTGFHPELTGRENVTLFGSVLGMPEEVIRKREGAVAE